MRTPTTAALLLLLLATGCADTGAARSEAHTNQPVTCMNHQSEPPGPHYTDQARRDTTDILTVLRYYTEHGRKPYCDGAGPTPADRAWGAFYTREGADHTDIATLTHP